MQKEMNNKNCVNLDSKQKASDVCGLHIFSTKKSFYEKILKENFDNFLTYSISYRL